MPKHYILYNNICLHDRWRVIYGHFFYLIKQFNLYTQMCNIGTQLYVNNWGGGLKLANLSFWYF